MKEIAIYGKGGIGKSTLTGNISAALSLQGSKVLQIGCDPKHDSTRLLMGGKEITTVLDYIRDTPITEYQLKDILSRGFNNIGCIEAGGPKPGVGCAGRGIITVFELLEQFKVKKDYDTIIYDVLGDVVCGGFAVPIRREYADTIFIVTSGEYMAIYAANNILRGIKNYDNNNKRVGGILYNKRNIEGEDERVRAFCDAVGLPIVLTIERSDNFTLAEKENRTLVQGHECKQRKMFMQFAKEVRDGIKLHTSSPLSDSELEEVVLGIKKVQKVEVELQEAIEEKEEKAVSTLKDMTNQNRYVSKGTLRNMPLHGCAFSGALNTSIHLSDVIVLSHSPKSCIYISYQSISSPLRRQFFERGATLPVFLAPNLHATNMGEIEMVFGGMEELQRTALELLTKKPKALVIISSCPSGIIGDDINQIKENNTSDTKIITIKTDGNLSGDFLQGMILAYTSLAKNIILRDVPERENTVNIIFERTIAKNTEDNFQTVRLMLERMGVSVNCRFLFDTTYEKLENFCTAPLNLPASTDYTGQLLREFFTNEYNSKFYDLAFPIGFDESASWVRGIGKHFNRENDAEMIISENSKLYEDRISHIKGKLQGKKLMIMTYNHELDWVLKAAIDVGIVIAKVCIFDFSQDEGFRTKLDIDLNIEENYDSSKRLLDIKKYAPDILLANYESNALNENCIADTIPMCPDVGFFSGVEILERWVRLFELKMKGGWRKDEQLCQSYLS